MDDRDSGQLNDAPLAPPYLTDLKVTPAQAVAMRREAGSQTVQQRRTVPVEIVPTPKPDSAASPEIVPTPQGTPIKIADRGDAANPFPQGVQGPEDYRTWPTPDLALVVTGQQHGYIEPCGCTGLDRQKGGVARRFTLLRELREQGWNLLPVDGGNQVRRFGRQAEVKLQQTVKALQAMDYQAVGFGPDDLRLGVAELLSVAASDPDAGQAAMYVSANVVLIDPSLMPKSKLIERNGTKVGITSVLDPDALEVATSDEILVEPAVESTRKALAELNAAAPNFKVLMFFGKEEAGHELARQVPGFDLLVVAGGYGEPTYRAEPIEGSETKMIVTGNKAMYVGLVGIFAGQPFKYARVELSDEYEDAPEMRKLMKEYQDQLRQLGLGELGLLPPIPHSSGHKFVGSAKCGECHTTAYEIWEGTPHAEATEHIIRPPQERGDVARHFDPECISCHVTGWNPQEYYPYASGYLSLEESEHLTGNGCEGCHGPGSEHVAAEQGDVTVADELRNQFRESMKLPLERARDKCMECHDLDNSPDFHEENAFEDVYWPQVEHEGLD
jgi:nitrate reductase cytochrome c-type subunit